MKKAVKKVKTQKDARGYMDLRRRSTTYKDVLGERVPIRKITNVRHRGAIHGIRDIARITWEPWEQEVSKMTQQLEKQRLSLANRFYIALAKIQSMLKNIQHHNEELHTTTEELQVTNEELQTTNEELQATAEELDRVNAELQQFANIASHDLQEPLRMIQSYTDLLIEQCEGKVNGDVKEFSEHITEGVTRMRALINGLLAYSRVGTHGKPLEPTDCNAVFEEAVNNLLVAVKESKASVTHDPLPTVSADSTQLTQLFQNLIGNAVKFQKKDVPPQVHVSAEYKEKEWVFSVQDNGIGIDPKYFERIFLPFQRLHTVAEYPGSGIGLATCKKIVERHGGRIWVSAEPSKGSVFYFLIPSPKE